MRKSSRSGLHSSTPLSAGSLVGVTIIMALNVAPQHARAQEAAAAPAALPEVVVTANRRNQNLESVPYSLSVLGGQQLAQAGVTDLASLALQVPGLSMYDYGARLAGATVPIIRNSPAWATSPTTLCALTTTSSPW